MSIASRLVLVAIVSVLLTATALAFAALREHDDEVDDATHS